MSEPESVDNIDSYEWCAVFIDGGYLEKICRNYFDNIKLDFEAFSDKLAYPHRRLRTYYYNAYPYQDAIPTEEQRERFSKAQRFYTKISRLKRFEVKFGKTVKRYTDSGITYFTQKGVDVQFAVDLVKLSWSGVVKYIVLLTGDNDFVPAVKTAKEAGVIIKLYYHPQAKPEDLINAVDESYEVTKEMVTDCKRE